MPFAYQEGDYTVERQQVLKLAGKTRTVEVRAPVTKPVRDPQIAEFEARWAATHPVTQPAEMKRYIAVTDSDGAYLDNLLYYLEGEDDLLEQDWAQIVSDPGVSFSTLRWERLIEDHGGGRIRGGGHIFF